MFFDIDKNKYVMQIDSTDRLINKIPKIEAHLKGIRHKAFSVLIFNNDGKMLIQKRAKEKYHSGGLWSNACCGHQIPRIFSPVSFLSLYSVPPTIILKSPSEKEEALRLAISASIPFICCKVELISAGYFFEMSLSE